MTSKRFLLFFTLFTITNLNLAWAENRIDTQRPDAPELSAYGNYAIGVRTLNMVNPDQIDILKLDPSLEQPAELPRYNRPLTVEVWYPAVAKSAGDTHLNTYIRDGKTSVTLQGKAIRDAKPLLKTHSYPLVIISHGYPGNRYLLAHLAENIASKGYVVASIDHTDSTYRTQAAFSSTLVNRPTDQLFVLEHIDKMSTNSQSFLNTLVDAKNTAIIGYSMGGYGAIINAGAGVTAQAVHSQQSPPFTTLSRHQTGKKPPADERIKTVIAFAPWGMNYGLWNEQSLQEITMPVLFIAGSQDDVSGYEAGVRAMWQTATKTERTLLTYDHANHNAGAVMPAPKEAYFYDTTLGFNISEHYTDAVWDTVRMNNIAQHFVSVWLNKHLKQNTNMDKYLNLVPNSNQAVWAMDKLNTPTADHTYWHGFKNRTAKGLRLETLKGNN